MNSDGEKIVELNTDTVKLAIFRYLLQQGFTPKSLHGIALYAGETASAVVLTRKGQTHWRAED